MSIVDCPECAGQISDKAMMCPHCGFARAGAGYGYEYRSSRRVFGLPLVHIIIGPPIDAAGSLRIAKGFIAIGGIAMGVFAFGGLAIGVVSMGGLAVGLAACGGAALGLLLAVGGLAVGTIAIGGCAVGYWAIGGGAFGVHVLSGNRQDPEILGFFKRYFGG